AQLRNSAQMNDIARLVQAMLEVGNGVGPARHHQALGAVRLEVREQLVEAARRAPLECGKRQHEDLAAAAAPACARALSQPPRASPACSSRSTAGGSNGSRSQRTPSAS